MRSTLLIAILLSASASAQYNGGSGRGDAASALLPTPISSSIFAGGNGRGDVRSVLQLLPSASNIFGGGNGRGDVVASFQLAQTGSSIFNGGIGRGDVALAFQTAPLASSIFQGGTGRGDVAIAIQPVPMASSIFQGGTGRGDDAIAFQNQPLVSSIFKGGSGRGDVTLSFDPHYVLVALRGMLEGPYKSSTGLMSDDLRAAGLIPLTEPFTAMGYNHTGGGGGETIASSVLAVTGANAIVDWVIIALHNPGTPYTLIASQSALVQRDGDVVGTDGVSPVRFNKPPGNFCVSMYHRNHLGAMALTPVALGASPMLVDLALASTTTYGTEARKSITGAFPVQALWAGNVNFNKNIRYTGTGNDRDPILVRVGSTVPTAVVSGYDATDVNMDGFTKYTGANNDRDPILINIGSTVPTASRQSQLP